MAAMKKTTTVKAVETKATGPVKKIEAAAAAKALEAKEAPKAEAEVEAAPVQTAPVKETEKKAAKTPVKPDEKATDKKKPGRKSKTAEEENKEAVPAPEKKTVQAKADSESREAEVKANINLQYAGKSYTTEDLIKITKDVWQYDLNKDVKDIKTVDLYVKPEENTVYYVINGTEEGNFGI